MFSLVIPCYNEEATIELILKKTKNSFLENKIELVLVNNGSTDNTKKILTKLKKNYQHATFINLRNNLGYGGGILAGLKHCKVEIIGWTHADLQRDPLDAVIAFKQYNSKENKNLYVKGNRQNRPIKDQFFTFGMSVFETILLNKIIYDVNAQPTIFSKDFYKSWENPPADFSLDLYSYYLALKKGLEIMKIKVEFKDRIAGESNWNKGFASKIKFILRTLKYSLKLKFKSIK